LILSGAFDPTLKDGFDAVEVSIFRPDKGGKTISLFAEGVREFCENPFYFGFS
jgi:hypothetical protein